jgi:glycerophosphoryl diester phosphodiesterase
MRFTQKALIPIAIFGGLLLAIVGMRSWSARPAAEHVYTTGHQRLWVLAHRGGRSLGPENTLYTFRKAADIGVDVIELDVRVSLDGQLVVIHDPTVDRTTNGSGRLQDMTLDQIKQLDAGHRWSPQDGSGFPLRGQGITVPTLNEVFESFPYQRINIEMKSGNGFPVETLCSLIRTAHRLDSVMVASFKDDLLDRFRSVCPEVATAAGSTDTQYFIGLSIVGLSRMYRPEALAFQVPRVYGDFTVVNRAFVSAAHERNMKVHVWTINDPQTMQDLIRMQVDGIVTDYPDRLLDLLQRL